MDEVSELSERQSVASSIEFSSDDTSSTASENDLEHTEYSVTPLIRSSRSISRGSGKEMIQALNIDEGTRMGQPQFLKVPSSKITSEAGQTITLEVITSGIKPIGKLLALRSI